MTVLDPSRLHSLVEAIGEIGTLGLDRQRGNPEHSDSREGMGRISRGHLRLKWTVDTWSLCLPANQEGSGPTIGPGGWRLTWRTQITALGVYWVLLFSACSVFCVNLKTEWGDWRGSCNLPLLEERWKSARTEVRTEVWSRKMEPAYYLVCLFLTKLPTDVIIKGPRGSVWHFTK